VQSRGRPLSGGGSTRAGRLPAAPRWALATVCAVLFLTFLDTTIVAVALSSVQSDLHAGVSELQWVVNAYALVFASLMLMAGTLSDRFGRKRLMLIGLGIFCGGSLLGALAPNPDVLIAARAVMGAGAAASEPGTLSVIRQMFPDAGERARALGAWAAVSALALAAGPVVGGFFVGVWSWRAVFVFNLVAGVVVMTAATRVLPESSDPHSVSLDLPGFAASSLALGALTFGIILGETDGYGSLPVVLLFAGGISSAVVFLGAERRRTAPMLDLRYMREPAFSGALIVAFAAFFGIFAIFFFTALYLQVVVGYSGIRTALVFLPMAVAMIVGALASGRLVARLGPRSPMAIGSVVAGAGILLADAVLTSKVGFAPLAVSLAVAGAGFGTVVVPVTSVTLGVVPAARSGMAASATNTSRELGSVFGVAILGALVNAHLTSDLSNRLANLHIPASYRHLVINAIETGSIPSGSAANGYARQYGQIVHKVIQAAYGAFRAGLDVALLAAGISMIIGALVAVLTLQGGDRWLQSSAELQTAATRSAPAAGPPPRHRSTRWPRRGRRRGRSRTAPRRGGRLRRRRRFP
jgi:EmrB/QacA subfamily drug resistance transporter